MNKIISILATVLLIGFVCFPDILENIKLKTNSAVTNNITTNKIINHDLVDELTCNQEAVLNSFNKLEISNWLISEIEVINKKLKLYVEKNKDTLMTAATSLKKDIK